MRWGNIRGVISGLGVGSGGRNGALEIIGGAEERRSASKGLGTRQGPDRRIIPDPLDSEPQNLSIAIWDAWM